MIVLKVLDTYIELSDNFRFKRQLLNFDTLSPATSISNSFNILLTKDTERLFNWVNDIQSNTKLPYENLDCQVSFGGTVYSGYLTIIKVENKKLSVVFRSGNVDFFDTIKGKTIPELNLDLDFVWNIQSANLQRTGYDAVFFNYDFGCNIENNKIDISHSLPFIPLYKIFEQIFIDNDFVLDSDCLKENGDYINDFKELFVSLVDYKLNYDLLNQHNNFAEVDYPADDLCENPPCRPGYSYKGISFNSIQTGIKTDYLTQNNIGYGLTSFFDVKQTGEYTIKFRLKFLWAEENSNAEGRAKLGEQPIYADDNPQILEAEFKKTYKKGDKIFLYGELINEGYGFDFSKLQILEDEESYFNITFPENAKIDYGMIYPVAFNLPALKQKDIILTVCNLFNLLFEIKNKTVTFYKLDNVLKNIQTGNVLDLSKKEYVIKQISFTSQFAQQNLLKYDDNLRQGVVNIEDAKLEKSKTLFKVPFNNKKRLDNFNRENVEATETEDGKYTFSFSALSKGVLIKRTYFQEPTYYRRFISGYNYEEAETHTYTPIANNVNLQDYINKYYIFFANTFNDYKKLNIEIKLDINDKINLLEPVYFADLGYFIVNNYEIQENKLTRIELIKIYNAGWSELALEGDFDKRDFDGRDFQ